MCLPRKVPFRHKLAFLDTQIKLGCHQGAYTQNDEIGAIKGDGPFLNSQEIENNVPTKKDALQELIILSQIHRSS